MTKRPPFVVIILVIIVCFALGILNVLISDPEEPTPLSDTPYPTPIETTDSAIQSILIVGVDDLRNLKPKLRSIWIAAYRSNEEVVYLYGFPLDSPIPGNEGTNLTNQFSWSSQAGLGVEFITSLYEILPLNPNITIVLDDMAFAAVVDYLGGADIRGNLLDGQGVLTFLSLYWDQPGLLLEHQATVMRAIIPKALDQPESPELTDLFSLVPTHVFLSADISTTVAKIYPLRDTDADSVFLILPEDMENP